MSQTIWKFPLDIADEVRVRMPAGAKVLSVGDQCGTLCLWALVDPEAPKEMRHFIIHGTGHPVLPTPFGELVHLGTVVQFGGDFVWHVFEWTAL